MQRAHAIVEQYVRPTEQADDVYCSLRSEGVCRTTCVTCTCRRVLNTACYVQRVCTVLDSGDHLCVRRV
jgi:hypothetical protein